MKKVIRRNCWETNSSSQHSIVVTKNDKHVTCDELTNYSDEYIYIWNRDKSWDLRDVREGFGRWPFRILTTFKDKFKYALCEYCGGFYGDEDEFNRTLDMFEELAKEILKREKKRKDK